MALRNILTVEEPVLHKTARPVTRFDAHLGELLDDMRQTLTNAGGVGLAAPQIGILRRVVVVDDDGELIELVNPEILETSGEQDGMEGCLSVPVPRAVSYCSSSGSPPVPYMMTSMTSLGRSLMGVVSLK